MSYAGLAPGEAVLRYCRRRLVVPPGHPAAGRPLRLPGYLAGFVRAALDPDTLEACLLIGRKNAKSAAVAALVLAHLDPDGPFPHLRAWRAGVLSVSRVKAGELLRQIELLAEHAQTGGVRGVEVRRTPAPDRIVSPQGEVEVESADRGAGHSAGFDLAVVDELGLLGEAHRELVAGMRSSVSARAGRFVSLSIQGVSPLTAEIIERRGGAGLVVHLFEADEDLPLDDPRAWRQANPGLGTVKSEAHMRSEAARVLATPADQAFFRAYELNQRRAPSGDLLATVDAWRRCEVERLPERGGRCVVGLDLGGSSSMTAAVALWESNRVETWAGFPDVPSLLDRSQTDGAGTVYAVAHDAGELELWPGRIVPAAEFVRRIVRDLAGERVIALGADGYRRAEVLQALSDGGCSWPFIGRGRSAGGMSSDHAHDVRAAERDIGTAALAVRPSGLLRSALRHTVRRENEYSHPYLCKSRANARIDLVSRQSE